MSGQARLMDVSATASPGATPGASTSAGTPVNFGLSPEIVVVTDPTGARAEAVRTLRTHIMAKHVGEGRRGLAICAASPNVGTTFTTANLGVALAQIGVKTLIIDGDMRQAGLGNYIRPSRPVDGLIQYLNADSVTMSDNIQSDVIENLSVLFAGGVATNAQELLASERFSELVERSLRDFDLTIIDTPPASSCADARRISTAVGYSLIVARRHESFIADIKALAGQLRDDGAHVVGAVMIET